MGWRPQLWRECDPHRADNQPANWDTPHISASVQRKQKRPIFIPTFCTNLSNLSLSHGTVFQFFLNLPKVPRPKLCCHNVTWPTRFAQEKWLSNKRSFKISDGRFSLVTKSEECMCQAQRRKQGSWMSNCHTLTPSCLFVPSHTGLGNLGTVWCSEIFAQALPLIASTYTCGIVGARIAASNNLLLLVTTSALWSLDCLYHLYRRHICHGIHPCWTMYRESWFIGGSFGG